MTTIFKAKYVLDLTIYIGEKNKLRFSKDGVTVNIDYGDTFVMPIAFTLTSDPCGNTYASVDQKNFKLYYGNLPYDISEEADYLFAELTQHKFPLNGFSTANINLLKLEDDIALKLAELYVKEVQVLLSSGSLFVKNPYPPFSDLLMGLDKSNGVYPLSFRTVLKNR